MVFYLPVILELKVHPPLNLLLHHIPYNANVNARGYIFYVCGSDPNLQLTLDKQDNFLTKSKMILCLFVTCHAFGRLSRYDFLKKCLYQQKLLGN